MEVKDARNRREYKQATVTEPGKVVYKSPSKGENKKHKVTVVVEKPTPTKNKPKDTRLYKGEGTSFKQGVAEKSAKTKARKKANLTPADSLSRGDFEKLKNPIKKKPKKKGLLKRRNK
tara:strand:+ start:62 stop:415 length:354 start_codon:yes stop_codon:yes gene_type:complete